MVDWIISDGLTPYLEAVDFMETRVAGIAEVHFACQGSRRATRRRVELHAEHAREKRLEARIRQRRRRALRHRQHALETLERQAGEQPGARARIDTGGGQRHEQAGHQQAGVTLRPGAHVQHALRRRVIARPRVAVLPERATASPPASATATHHAVPDMLATLNGRESATPIRIGLPRCSRRVAVAI